MMPMAKRWIELLFDRGMKTKNIGELLLLTHSDLPYLFDVCIL